MDEYISKEYLSSKLRDGQFETGGMSEVIQGRELEPFTIYKSLVVAWQDIQNAPTADVVEVVRCKDCIHAQNMPLGLCYLHTEPYDNAKGYKGDAVCVEPNDFCSYGERKE